LSGVASVLLLVASVLLLKGDAGGAGAAPVMLVGLGLLVASLRSLKARRLG
jgi:hypothetical protein